MIIFMIMILINLHFMIQFIILNTIDLLIMITGVTQSRVRLPRVIEVYFAVIFVYISIQTLVHPGTKPNRPEGTERRHPRGTH